MRRLLLYFLVLQGFCVFSQKQITESFNQATLEDVFGQLEKKYGLTFAYDADLIRNVKITVKLDNLSAKEAIGEILGNTELSFHRVKKNYFTIVPSTRSWTFTTKIIDNEGEGIPYAKVRVVGTYKGAYADENGKLTFEYHSDKPPQLEFSSIGYKKQNISVVEVKNGGNTALDLDIQEFEEVVVEYLTEGISISDDVSSITIHTKKIGAVPGTTEPDIFQLIQNVPGINSVNSTVTEIQIRGGTADQNHLLWDGIPIYDPGHFNGMISSVNPNIIDQAKLHRGVYDPYFGGKVSGLIELSSINYIPEKPEAGAGINMIQGDAYVKAPIGKKFAVLISGRRSYMDVWKSPTYNQYADRVYQETSIENSGVYSEEPEFEGQEVEVFEVTNRFVFYDLNGKMIFKPNSNNLITASALYTRNTLDYSTNFKLANESETNLISSSNFGLGLNYKKIWNKKYHSTFLANYAKYSYNFSHTFNWVDDSISYQDGIDKNNSVNHYEFKWNNIYKPLPDHKISFGYQLAYNAVRYELIYYTDTANLVSEIGSNEGITNAANLNYQFKKNRFLGRLGMRLSHLTTTQEFYFEPRIYTQYGLTDWLTVKGAFGLQNQYVSQVDEFEGAQLGLSNRIWVMADEIEIPVINSMIINAGVVVQSRGWHISLDAYYKILDDIVNFSADPSLSSGLLRGSAISKGFDFLIRKRWKNYRSWISYTLSDVKYEFPDLESTPYSAPFNQLHTLKWVNTLSWRQFEFSTSYKIASGKPYTSILDIVLHPEAYPGQPEEERWGLYYDKFNDQRLPFFHQLDVTAFFTFPKNPEKNWRGKIGVSCFNVYNAKNVLNRFYNLDINYDDPMNPIVNPFAIDKYYLGITPNVLIRFEF